MRFRQLLVVGLLCVASFEGQARAQQVSYEELKARATQAEAAYNSQIKFVCDLARQSVASDVDRGFSSIKGAMDQLVRLMPTRLREALTRAEANLSAHYAEGASVPIDPAARVAGRKELTAFAELPEVKAAIASIEAKGYVVRFHTEEENPPSIFVEERTSDGRPDYTRKLFVSYFGGKSYSSNTFEVWTSDGSKELAKVCNDGRRQTSGETVWEFTVPSDVNQKRFYDYDKRTAPPAQGSSGAMLVP